MCLMWCSVLQCVAVCCTYRYNFVCRYSDLINVWAWGHFNFDFFLFFGFVKSPTSVQCVNKIVSVYIPYQYVYLNTLSAFTHCTTLHHIAPQCTTPRHTAPPCNALQRTGTHCYILQHTALKLEILQIQKKERNQK